MKSAKLKLAGLLFGFACFCSCGLALASEKVVEPLGKKDIEKYLDLLSKNHSNHELGFNPNNRRIEQIEGKGPYMIMDENRTSYTLIYACDVNNDSEVEHVAAYMGEGSLQTSGILSVVGEDYKIIEFAKVVSKNLWNDDSGDLSKFHLWMGDPFIVKREGQYFLRFKDKKPKPVTYEYLWKGDTFKKVKTIPAEL